MAENQQQQQKQQPRKQSVWFVRYGLTEHPLVEDLGPYDSDIDPTEGIDHAVSIAKRIASGVTENSDSIPKVVYASPFLRTAHTAYIIANELQQQQHQQSERTVELRLEEGLWEWLIPSLLVTKADGIKTHPRPIAKLKEDLLRLEEKRAPRSPAIMSTSYTSVNPYDDSGDVGVTCVPAREIPATPGLGDGDCCGSGRRPIWIESEDDLLERCETTLLKLLDSHTTDAQSLCIVSHAPCDQAMAFCLEKQQSSPTKIAPKDSKLTPWPLGGITMFSRDILYDVNGDATPTGYGNWKMELYGDTEHMPGEYKTGLKEWSLPCFVK